MFQALLDAIVEAFQTILDWMNQLAQDYLGFDFNDINIADELAYLLDSIGWLNEFVPINGAVAILLTGVATRYTIRGIRHLIGWVPGVEG